MLLWSITDQDIVDGLRRRGLPVHSLSDLTSEEICLIRQYADWAFNEAQRALLDAPTARIKRNRELR
jgi:hypothetical protein